MHINFSVCPYKFMCAKVTRQHRSRDYFPGDLFLKILNTICLDRERVKIRRRRKRNGNLRFRAPPVTIRDRVPINSTRAVAKTKRKRSVKRKKR